MTQGHLSNYHDLKIKKIFSLVENDHVVFTLKTTIHYFPSITIRNAKIM